MKKVVLLLILISISAICFSKITYGSYMQKITKENHFTIAPVDEVTIDWSEIISIQWTDYPYETKEATN